MGVGKATFVSVFEGGGWKRHIALRQGHRYNLNLRGEVAAGKREFAHIMYGPVCAAVWEFYGLGPLSHVCSE